LKGLKRHIAKSGTQTSLQGPAAYVSGTVRLGSRHAWGAMAPCFKARTGEGRLPAVAALWRERRRTDGCRGWSACRAARFERPRAGLESAGGQKEADNANHVRRRLSNGSAQYA